MTWEKFFYKISKDLLISLLITYFFLLVPELILPGITSSHFNPKYVLVLILVTAWAYSWLGRKFSPPQENVRFKAISRNLLNALLVIITAMLILSLYKMKLWEIAVVTAFSIALIVTSQKFILDEKDS